MTNKGYKGLGTLKNTEKDEIFLPPVIAITPEKVPLGTISVQRWKRPEQSVRAEHQCKPIEEKASYYWIEGYPAAGDIQAQAPDTLIVSIDAREGDIYELLIEMHDYAPAQRAAWISRAAQDRRLKTAAGKTAQTLREKLRPAAVFGETQFTIPGRNGKPAGPASPTCYDSHFTSTGQTGNQRF